MFRHIKKDYDQLKDEIFEHKIQDDNNDFIKLLQLKEISDELKETLILLHSNYSTEIKDAQSHYIKLLIKTIDRNVDLLEHLNSELNRIENLVEKLGQTETAPIAKDNADNDGWIDKLTHLNKIHKTWILILFTVICLVALNEYSPDGLDKAINIFKSIFSFGLIPTGEEVRSSANLLKNGIGE